MQLKAVIGIQQDAELSSATTSAENNNVSNTLAGFSGGYKGFQLSERVDQPVTPLNGSYKFFPEEGYPGWMSKQLSGADGYFESPISWFIAFTASVKHVTIVFDETLEEYATEIRIYTDTDSQVIYNESPRLTVPLEETTQVTITFLRWSAPFKTAKVTSIDDDENLILRGSAIASLECSDQAWNASFNIATGLMQQYADVVFNDFKGVLSGLSDAGILSRFMPVNFYILYKGTWKHLGEYTSNTWSVNKVTNVVKLNCNDLTRTFENYVVDVTGENISVTQVFELLSAQLPEDIVIVPKPNSTVINPFTGEELTMAAYLDSCICKDIYFQKVAASEIINQLCDRWMLRLYWDVQLKKYVVMEAW